MGVNVIGTVLVWRGDYRAMECWQNRTTVLL